MNHDLFIDLPSSYRKHNLGMVLHNLVIHYRPKTIVEFGVLHGYSTVHMAQGLKLLDRGHLYGYDLWDKYPYRCTTLDMTESNLRRFEVDPFVTLAQVDFFEWLENPTDFDMLHVDISNDGDVIEKMLTKLEPQINNGAIVVFEGGSVERDQYSWMVDYGKRPINPLQEKFGFEVIDERFPSISLMKRS